MGRLRLASAVAAVCAAAACGGSGSTPHPVAPPIRPLSAQLTAADRELHAALRKWRTADPDLRSRPPRAVLRAAAAERAIVHRLAASPALARRTIAQLGRPLHASVALEVRAAVDLRRLAGPPSSGPVHHLHLVPPLPAGTLLADYRRAEARFHVRWQTLAAVHLIESAFGRVVNRSSAGAQGPMQFMPATWRAYGLGGDVHSARDAILGAANYLHRSGAPGDQRRALFAYNHSTLYVDAVLAYARAMTVDPLGFAAYYAWEASLPSVL
ncbi:MAG TPA: lytic transglycosylase domain-containing protein [Gaiellales bacterium]|nr:lytic transglycosylase domain-containing protein [Gaiellales bacterium]